MSFKKAASCFEGARLEPRHNAPQGIVIPSDVRPNRGKGAQARDLQLWQKMQNCRFLASRSLHLRALQVAFVFLVATFFLGADPSGARFENLGHKLMCRCGCSQILLECNHVGCSYSEKMRQELMAALQGPDSDDLILQRFVQEYGGVVLAAPTNTGFNRVAWITPFAALGLGIFGVVYVVRRWKQRPVPLAAEAAAAPPLSLEVEALRERARKETEL